MRSAETKERLERELLRYVDLLVRHYKPQRILLFGSLATGNVHEYSDIDLIVIKKTNKRFLERLAEVLMLLDPHEALDVLVYTPEEFETLCRERPFFQEEIVKKAQVIYDERSPEVAHIRSR